MRRNPRPLLAVLFAGTGIASAQDGTAAAGIDSGHTAMMIMATVLVLFMTLPGLALFYGGLVRTKNVLSVLMHCFAVACLASLLWVVVGYSMAFEGSGKWVGDFSKVFLKGLTLESKSGKIPESVFIMFQMTFAIITPGLIIGAFVERMKFSAVMLFSGLWMVLVYFPAVHWVWDDKGLMFGWGAKDLAGGIVVHATAGVSALILAKMLGPRREFPDRLIPPHSPVLVVVGASMLWVGWFGFNAGSQLAANEAAGMTMLVTHLSAATAALTWMLVETFKAGKPGIVGIVTGMVAGMATITPASGNVGPMGAILIGFTAGIVCYFMCGLVKGVLKIDDSLDVFAVHGVGGILGTLLVAFLGSEKLGGMGLGTNPVTGQAFTMVEQFVVQVKSLGVTILWSAVATVGIVFLTKKITGLRVDEDTEYAGLDQSEHGERGYHFEND